MSHASESYSVVWLLAVGIKTIKIKIKQTSFTMDICMLAAVGMAFYAASLYAAS